MTALYVLRVAPPALVELGQQSQILREMPIAVPGGCKVENLFAPPEGTRVAMELGCNFGQAVVWVDADRAMITQPVTDSDSHFLAWAPDGQAAYLKVDTMNRPRIVRAPLVGKPRFVPITELTYDLAPLHSSQSDFLFSFSRGMGLGSEIWLARDGGRVVQQVFADPHNYISFARWSPDGSKIAFIRIPDSNIPFAVGELWIMQADGSGARELADVDAGHGFAEAWSPDGSRIAFVARENPRDARADQVAEALRSNITVVSIADGSLTRLTHFESAQVQAPAWSPDGNQLAFTVVLDDKMNVYSADIATGQVQTVLPDAAFCPVWIRK